MFGIGGKIAAGMGIGMIVLAGAFGLYFKHSQSQIANLNQTVATERTAADNANANLKQLQQQIDAQKVQLTVLSKQMSNSRKEQQKITEIFAKHDLGKLANAKPGLIQEHVNSGTQNLFKELESVTDPDSYDQSSGK